MKKLYLVDVSSMFFRAFYAIRPLSNPAGMPVNALYGFLSMTVKLLREIGPDYMAFCFDRSGPTFRSTLDANYKANRSEMPAELVPQIPYFRRLSEALGIACFDHEGFEADDVIGTLTRFGRQHDLDVVIVSGDKDFGQLVSSHVSMYDTMKDVRYDQAGVVEKWGVEARKMIDYLAIVGDASDNVPGVAGIGVKGAQKLLADFDSIEEIYANLEKISSVSTRKKLEASKSDAFLSKKLATIVCDVPIRVVLDDLRLKPIVRDDLQQLLEELDFKTIAKTLLGPPQETKAMTDASVAEVTSHVPASSVVIEKRLDVSGLANWLQAGDVTWALRTDRASYLAQASSDVWTIAEVAAHPEEIGALLTEKRLRLRGFDLKDFCKRHRVLDPIIDWDQMLAAYVIRAGNIENTQQLFALYNGEALPDLASPSQLINAHLRLESQLRRKLAAIGGEKILFEIEQPLVPILLIMENTGILIDQKTLLPQSEALARDIGVLEREIHLEAGEIFSIGSPKQLGQVLFEKLKMPTGKRTKTGYSTDEQVLSKLAKEFPITSKILQWRELSKLKSTYVDALPLLVNPTTGRIHTTFNQALTATGRLSSTNPNLQNIPIRTERGNLIRKAFVAAPGYQLVSVDYSQIELRVLAHITGDQGLVRAFEANIDVHAATASEVFEVPLASVTPEMRRKAKAVNFGLAYGLTAFGLAERLAIPRGEASEIINRYFARFSGVKTYMTDTIEEAKKKGYVETIFGRRRYLDELFSKNANLRNFGERAAINAPIQGTASDLVKLAMIKAGVPDHARPLLQVHDELVLEAERAHVSEVVADVSRKMENIASLRVPLRVNTGVGPSWEEAHS